MNLSRRTALILSLTSILGLGGMAVVSGVVLDDAFSRFERKDAERDLDRVEAAVQSDLDDLAWTATQLGDLGTLLSQDAAAGDGGSGGSDGGSGSGDDGNAFTRSADLIASLLGAGDLDVVAYASANGTWGAFTIDLDALGRGEFETAFQNATPGLVTALAASETAQAEPLRPHSDVVRADGEAYLLGARTLTDLEGNVTAVVAALRLVDDGYLEELSNRTRLDVGARLSDGSTPHELQRDGYSTWTATRALPADAPALELQVTGERDIYQQGILSFLLVVGGAALISALILAASLLAMRATVTGRLHALADRVAAVRSEGDLSARVGIAGHDELADLSHEFDLMLADLEGRSNELQRSNEELGAFASVVSHDLKSPLSTFSMNLAVMKRIAEREDDPKQLERVARMERTVATMQGRIEAVLEYSRAGREPKKNVVPLDDLARTVLEDVEANLVEAGAEVELEPLPSVRGDRQALAQVLQNLIQNAVKYRKEDVAPRIRVHAHRSGVGWAVVVEDNGRGFKPEDAEKMLQPFSRLDNVGDQTGHGVGLATCQRIMQVHDGALKAEGEEGVGAKMTMWFPDARVLAAPTAARAANTGEFTRAAEARARKKKAKAAGKAGAGKADAGEAKADTVAGDAEGGEVAKVAEEAEVGPGAEASTQEAFEVVEAPEPAPEPEPKPAPAPEPEPEPAPRRREVPPRPEWLVRAEAEKARREAASDASSDVGRDAGPDAGPDVDRIERLHRETARAHAPALDADAPTVPSERAERFERPERPTRPPGTSEADWRSELEARFGPVAKKGRRDDADDRNDGDDRDDRDARDDRDDEGDGDREEASAT